MRRALLAAALAAALPASAYAYHPSGERWPGRPAVIRYFNATGYANELGLAAGAWNHSGARVRFVAVWSAGEYERRSRAPLLVHLTL